VLLALLLGITVALWLPARERTDVIGWAGWRDQSRNVWQGLGISSRSQSIQFHYFVGMLRFDDPYALDGVEMDATPHVFHHVLGSVTQARPDAGPFERIGFAAHKIHFPGFQSADFSTLKPVDFFFVRIPDWLIATICVAGMLRPAVRLLTDWRVSSRKRRRRRAGLCTECGYDLRAAAKRCPECGRFKGAM